MTYATNDFDFSNLSAPERLLLAQHLLDSVLADAISLTPQEMEEIRRRARGIDSGEIVCEPWESVRTRLLRLT
jgi:putative addiction module component (TIGR02574 family)